MRWLAGDRPPSLVDSRPRRRTGPLGAALVGAALAVAGCSTSPSRDARRGAEPATTATPAATTATGTTAPGELARPSSVEGRLPDGRTVRLEIDAAGAPRLVPLPDAPADQALPYLWPPIIDSHVHLAYWAVAEQLLEHGVAAAVDLGAPLSALASLRRAPIVVRFSGPLLTRPGGYPLDGWGSDGYGLACDAVPCVERAVADLAERGASVIKLALGKQGLAPELVGPAVAAAHRAGLKVAAHALREVDAALAARAGCDLLAHTPTEKLSPATVLAWRGRAVISTLAAFGGGAAAVDNLRRLRAAGATVLYGTDLGNQRDAGPSDAELALLRQAGLDDAALVEAMTLGPARYWKLDGSEAPAAGASGASASPEPIAVLVLSGDPRRDVRLLKPRAVVRRGHDHGMATR